MRRETNNLLIELGQLVCQVSVNAVASNIAIHSCIETKQTNYYALWFTINAMHERYADG